MLNPVKECVEMAVTLTLGCGLKLFFSQFSIHQRKTRNSYKYLLIKTEQFFYRLRYTLYSFKYFARNSLKASDDFVQLFTVTDKKKKKKRTLTLIYLLIWSSASSTENPRRTDSSYRMFYKRCQGWNNNFNSSSAAFARAWLFLPPSLLPLSIHSGLNRSKH